MTAPEPFYARGGIVLYHGDNRRVAQRLDPGSMGAIVTDPPYELGFMGRAWDRRGIAYSPRAWALYGTLLRPGGHLLAFGGSRTFHRMTVAIEDAGFEIRDVLSWLYGQGFPKSHDVSKAIDALHGTVTAPDTPEAAQWDGWGTALKPAWEPVVLGRKPLAGTVAANVLQHGTGALNIDGCRIGTETVKARKGGYSDSPIYGTSDGGVFGGQAGRWPANVVLDEAAAAALDAQSVSNRRGVYGEYAGEWDKVDHNDTGGASRFFYVAKASRRDRGEGNDHPTVKPLALMRWLLTLVAAPGLPTFDPFAGSGTTLVAAARLGIPAVGIEGSRHNCEIAARRLEEAFDE